MLKVYEILVPTVDNNGKPFRTRYHRVWDKKVYELAGGISILTPIKGKWVNDDTLYEERNIPVRIACTPEQFQEILAFTLKYYDQIAIMGYVISEEVFIYKG